MTRVERWGLLIVGAVAWLGVQVGAARAEEVLPKPPPPFRGKIDMSRDKSMPDWPRPAEAPPGAPNIVLVLLDDVGFGATSAFGGPVETPELEKLAANGLRYNQFLVNATCSPPVACCSRVATATSWGSAPDRIRPRAAAESGGPDVPFSPTVTG
jgi:hypothetical protein